jgi:hypothetical protein
MGFQMNTDQVTCLLNNDPGGSVGYRENPVTGFDLIVTDIFLEPLCNFQGQEGNLRFFSAFGDSDDNLSVLNISGFELQDFADAHAAPCHKFEHQAVSWILGSENDLIDHILFQDLELSLFAGFEKFPQGGIIAWILEIRIERIFDEIEKGSQEGESQFFCALFRTFCQFGHESQNVFRGDAR